MSQQRRAQVTRRAIVVAAAEEFDRVGYEATPLSAVLRRSGVTKGAFYFHFRSKEAVAEELVRFQEQSWARLRERWESRDWDPLSTAVGLTGEAMWRMERSVLLRAGARLRSQPSFGGRPGSAGWERMLGDCLREAAARGLLLPRVDPAAAARVVHAALVGTGTVGFERGGAEIGMAQRVSELWQVLLNGMATAEWLREHRLSRLLSALPDQ